MKKSVVSFGLNNNLTGVLFTPETENHLPPVLFINAGVIYRIGPNRIYYKMACQLAQAGFITFRFDFSGIGDSEMPDVPTQSFVEYQLQETREAIDFLLEQNKKNKLILIGICSGADIASQIALQDSRIAGVILINGYCYSAAYLKHVYPIAQNILSIKYYKKYGYHYNRLLKLVTGRSNIAGNIRKILCNKRIKSKDNPSPFTIRDWGKIIGLNTSVLLIFSEGSVFYEIFRLHLYTELKKNYSDKDITTIRVKNTDHVFTTIWSQEYLCNQITQWLQNNSYR